VASVQIEQLRAGRERLLESYGVVRRTLEEVNDELNRADAEARAAADEVGRRMQREHAPEPDTAPAPPHAAETAATDTELEAEAPPQPDPPGPDASGPGAEPAPETGRGGAKRRGRAEAQAMTATVEPSHEAATTPDDATVPHLRVVSDRAEGTTASSHPAAPGSKVDMLFARIRAGRADKTPTPEPAATAGANPAEEGQHDQEEEEGETPRSDDDEALLQQREAAITDVEGSLTRKLKRTLQDEQNDLLDRLRGLRGEPSADRLLPNLAEHVARYADAAQPLVEQAAAAGVTFANRALDRTNRSAAHPPPVSDLAQDAATTIVESLRRRLEHALSVSAGDEQAVLVEALGAGYREWKSERIERVAGDVLAAAFSRGTWHEAPDGTLLRWIVDDTDGPCPDCDDDVLAGNLPKGEAFPTGQLYPPAHPGCRCLLVPVKG
jgi:hypothetical protein